MSSKAALQNDSVIMLAEIQPPTLTQIPKFDANKKVNELINSDATMGGAFSIAGITTPVGINYGNIAPNMFGSSQIGKWIDFNASPFAEFNDYTGTNDMPSSYGLLGTIKFNLPPSANAKFAQLGSLLFNEWLNHYKIPQWVRDEYNAKVFANETEKKNFWQKIKQQLNSLSQGVQQAVGNITQAVTNPFVNVPNSIKEKIANTFDKLKNLSKQIPFAVLLPFKPAMRNELQRRGFSVSNDLNDVVLKFHSHVIKGQNFASFDPATFAALLTPENINAVSNVAGSGGGIIKDVFNFFLTLFNKPNLAPNETAMLNEAEAGINSVNNELEPKKGGGIGKLLLIGAAIFILFKIIKK